MYVIHHHVDKFDQYECTPLPTSTMQASKALNDGYLGHNDQR